MSLVLYTWGLPWLFSRTRNPPTSAVIIVHDFLTNPPTAIEATTGEVHRRHHISPTGFYRGKKVIATKADE